MEFGVVALLDFYFIYPYLKISWMEFGVMASILIAAFAFASTTLLFTLLRYSISTTKLLD